MSDGFFDAMRDRGEYPPKGWGWHEHHEKLEKAEKWWKRGNRDPWLVEFVEFHMAHLIDVEESLTPNNEEAP